MLKIARDGSVTDSADAAAKPFFGQLADVHTALAEANAGDAEPAGAEARFEDHPGTGEEMHGIGHPADGTMSPPAGDGDGEPAEDAAPVPPEAVPDPSAPLAPPRTPPRRVPPPVAEAG